MKAGAEERANRNVADHLTLDGALETLPNLIDEIGFAARIVFFFRGEFQIQVLGDLQSPVPKNGIMASRKLANSPEHGVGVRHPEEGQIFIEAAQIELSLNSRDLQQRLDL